MASEFLTFVEMKKIRRLHAEIASYFTSQTNFPSLGKVLDLHNLVSFERIFPTLRAFSLHDITNFSWLNKPINTFVALSNRTIRLQN